MISRTAATDIAIPIGSERSHHHELKDVSHSSSAIIAIDMPIAPAKLGFHNLRANSAPMARTAKTVGFMILLYYGY
jgi:hypothetical protein